jgi:hypothetical protein
MSKRRARGLGKRVVGARAPRRMGRKRIRAGLRRWALPALLAAAAVVALAALWRSRPPRDAGAGEPLSRTERRRAETPLSADARAWLVGHGDEVRATAAAFDVSPIALGGIVAAEKTLLTGRIDAIGEEVFLTVFGSLREEDLTRWAADQEREYQRRLTRGGGRPTLLTPYLWTLGPAQVSLRLAILNEPAVAQRMGRPRRGVKEVVEAVIITPGNLEYAAALLAEAERAYADVAGVDIAADPGLLATLYHLGSPTVRARRLAADNALREERGTPPDPPRMNWYGAFVDRNVGEIAALLDLPRPAGASGGAPQGAR